VNSGSIAKAEELVLARNLFCRATPKNPYRKRPDELLADSERVSLNPTLLGQCETRNRLNRSESRAHYGAANSLWVLETA
jgi:hypothetical protein